MSDKREVVFLSGVRTAIGTYGGSLKDQPAVDMAALCTKEAVNRSGTTPESIGHVVFGNVLHSDVRDMYISRYAGLKGGLPIETPALTVNRLCGSGLQAIITGAQAIMLGDADAVVAGGAESLTRTPYWNPTMRWGQRMGDGKMIDPMNGALSCPINAYHMGVTAENVAEKWGISREEQDELAAESQRRAANATENGYFKDQIIPIELKSRKGTVIFDTDEHVKPGTTAESLSKLRPVFKKDGLVTAGNASGLNDGAAAVVMMERSQAEAQGLKPMARLVGYSFAGVEPEYMGIGPIPAIKKLFTQTGLTKDDMDVIELNEAFASQALAVVHDLGLPAEKVNPNGSGISLGHPIGATGAVITVKALHELQRTNGRYALISMCIGGGQGIAAIIEKI